MHALDHLDGGLDPFALFDGDHAVLPDLLHGIGDDLPDVGIVGRNAGDVGDVLLALNRDGDLLQLVHHGINRFIDASFEEHRVAAGRDVPQALPHDRPGQHGCRGRAVSGQIVGLAGDFLHELRPHVLVGVFQLDLFGHRDAVLCDGGRTPFLLKHDIAAPWAQRHPDGAGDLLHATLERAAGFLVVQQDLCWH